MNYEINNNLKVSENKYVKALRYTYDLKTERNSHSLTMVTIITTLDLRLMIPLESIDVIPVLLLLMLI